MQQLQFNFLGVMVCVEGNFLHSMEFLVFFKIVFLEEQE